MKKLLIATILGLLSVTAYGKARIPYCSDCEYLQFVAELPDDSTFMAAEYGAHLDMGYKYKQFWLVWVPIWNYEGEYCLMIKGKEDVFFSITPEELKAYKEKYKLDLPENPLSFWNKIGGKLIVGALAGLAIYGLIPSKEDKVKEETPQEAS